MKRGIKIAAGVLAGILLCSAAGVFTICSYLQPFAYCWH